jgi:RNA polymerase sigma-70 factor (ECF subfamily)
MNHPASANQAADPTQLFEQQRNRLVGLAYRLTGSRSEAEDIVHETYLRWTAADQQTIDSASAWLARVTTNLALDYLKSARVQRESYLGPWLPEPYVEHDHTPQGQYELDQSISIALMLTLERLSPSERAAFILHDVFQFDFNDIATMLDKSAPACRKLASRARNSLRSPEREQSASTDALRKLSSAFFGAVQTGDMGALTQLLVEDVGFRSDGGGKVSAARRVLRGRNEVATFLVKVVHASTAAEPSGSVALKEYWFNGAPGFVLYMGGEPVSAFSFELRDGMISEIYVVRNPEKLSAFQ